MLAHKLSNTINREWGNDRERGKERRRKRDGFIFNLASNKVTFIF